MVGNGRSPTNPDPQELHEEALDCNAKNQRGFWIVILFAEFKKMGPNGEYHSSTPRLRHQLRPAPRDRTRSAQSAARSDLRRRPDIGYGQPKCIRLVDRVKLAVFLTLDPGCEAKAQQMREAEYAVSRARGIGAVLYNAQNSLVRLVMQPVQNVWRLVRSQLCRNQKRRSGNHTGVKRSVSAGHMGVDGDAGIDNCTCR